MIKVDLKYEHSSYSDIALNRSIIEILEGNILLAMATVKGVDSWICTAYYCYNNALEFYILTEPQSQHAQNLSENDSVALSIYNSSQNWDNEKRGLQVFGNCRRASGMEIAEAIKLYSNRFVGLGKRIKHPSDFKKGIIDSRFYKIDVRAMRLFDEVYFGKNEFIDLTPKIN